MVDDKGFIVAVNAEVCRLFDYDKEALIGESVDVLVPERLRARHLEHRRGYRATPKTCRMGSGLDLYGRRRDGTEFPIEMDLHPVDSPDGLRVLGLLRDTSTEKVVRDELKASLQKKEDLLRELHHRVHNNMQVLSSLLNVQKQGLDDPAQEVLEHARAQIRAMSLVHQALQRSDDATHVDLADYFSSLISDTKQAHGATTSRIRVEAQIAPVKVRADLALVLGRILHEAVSNSLKHAFDEATGGEIVVRVVRRGRDELEISVADNGRGVPPPGTASPRAGLGLELMSRLVEQLGGTIDIRSGPGVAVLIRLKYADSTGEDTL
jgi:PAS domain S-box-containing protein